MPERKRDTRGRFVATGTAKQRKPRAPKMTSEQRKDAATRRRLTKRLDDLISRSKVGSPGKRLRDMDKANEIAKTLGMGPVFSAEQIRKKQSAVINRYG